MSGPSIRAAEGRESAPGMPHAIATAAGAPLARAGGHVSDP